MTAPPLVFCMPQPGILVAPAHCGLLAVPDLISQLKVAAASGGPLVVDLSRVQYASPELLRALAWAGNQCTSAGVSLRVVMPGQGVLRPSEEAMLAKAVVVHAHIDDALTGVG